MSTLIPVKVLFEIFCCLFSSTIAVMLLYIKTVSDGRTKYRKVPKF